MDKPEEEYYSSNCLSFSELKAYLADNISNEERASYKNHINTCDFCKDAIDGISNRYFESDLDTKISLLKGKIRQRSASPYFNRGRFLYYRNLHRWVSYISVAACLFIIIGTFYYINFSWSKYSEIASEKYEIRNNTIEGSIIPAHYFGGEENFKKKFKKNLQKDYSEIQNQNIVLVFMVDKLGEISNVRTPNISSDSIHAKIESIVFSLGKWSQATQNDIFIDSEVRIIIPII